MSSKTKARQTRKRYTSDEKKEIVAFAQKHDAENGRGGKSAAVKKFGISPISLASWMKESGSAKPSGKKRGRKPGSKNVKKSGTGGTGNYTAQLKELMTLAGLIDKAESGLDTLRKKFHELKSAL